MSKSIFILDFWRDETHITLSASYYPQFSLPFLPPATKLRRLCFYRHVSVQTRGGVCLSLLSYHTPWEQTPPIRHHSGQTPPQVRHWPQVRHPPGQTPPGQTPPSTRSDTPNFFLHFFFFFYTPRIQETATAADGTHPTGMHSCVVDDFHLSRGSQGGEIGLAMLISFRLLMLDVASNIPKTFVTVPLLSKYCWHWKSSRYILSEGLFPNVIS